MNAERPIKHIPLIHIVDFWQKKKLSQEKGGSFNLNLYLAVCRAKKNQDGESNS